MNAIRFLICRHCCVPVGRYYNFTSSGPGSYKFEPVSKLQVLEDDGSMSVLIADTIPATVEISGKLSSGKKLRPDSLGGVVQDSSSSERLGKRATFVYCSAETQQVITTAIGEASDASYLAMVYADDNPHGSDLQTTWFGLAAGIYSVYVTAALIDTFGVRRFFLSFFFGILIGIDVFGGVQILDTAFAQWNYDCSCITTTTYAYVFPSQYGTIHLCPPFWTLDDETRGELRHVPCPTPTPLKLLADFLFWQNPHPRGNSL